MTISEEAVEAAARALAVDQNASQWIGEKEWDGIVHQARVALEAAAPCIKADALREAADLVSDQEGLYWAEGRQRQMWLRKLADSLEGEE